MKTTTIDPFTDIPASPVEINPDKQKEIAALSGYELVNILKAATDYVEKNKWGFYSSVDETVKSSLGYLIRTVEAAHEAHDKAMEEHYTKLDDSYRKFYEKNRDLRKQIAELPPIKFPDVSYVNIDGLQRLFDMAEKLSTLSDNKWGRLLQLAEALKEK
jgi:hypothetical protein